MVSLPCVMTLLRGFFFAIFSYCYTKDIRVGYVVEGTLKKSATGRRVRIYKSLRGGNNFDGTAVKWN